MVTWDIYDGNSGKLLRQRVSTELLAPTLLELQAYERIPFMLRPGGSPNVSRVTHHSGTFICPSCKHAVLVGDVFTSDGDVRTCSVFCLRRLTTGRVGST